MTPSSRTLNGFYPLLQDPRSAARIGSNGAVLLGRSFTVDAHARRWVRVVTHAHADHVLELGKSFNECRWVAMTPATRELVKTIYGLEAPGEKLKLLSYGEKLRVEDECLTLYQAGHILGSAQALVETQGFRVVYTGDFRLPEAPILRSDLLVIEATYGNPSCTRPFKERVEQELADLVKSCLKRGPVGIFGYHGKLQEVAGILRREGVEEPILMPKRVYEVARACERHGLKLGDFLLAESEEGRRAIKQKHVALYHMRSASRVKLDAKIYLSGWEFEKPVKRVGEHEFEVALSDHSDFEQLLEYVRKSSPRYVITDDFRVGDAKALAREIRRRLGIPASPAPRTQPSPRRTR